jgi:hypothetical protein
MSARKQLTETSVFDSNGIDWLREPADEREAKLRRAFIEQLVERKKGDAAWVYFALRSLAGSDTVGSDLQAAVSEWHERFSAELAERKRVEYSELLELAHRELETNTG